VGYYPEEVLADYSFESFVESFEELYVQNSEEN
jgi:hypothetical protein